MAPRARMLCKLGAMRGKEFEIGATATIGRAADNDVVLTPKEVSSSHARIVWDDEAESFFLEDLGSLNGTALDGVPVSGRERLGRLHVITFGGGLDLIYQGPELAAGRPAPAPPGPPGEGTMVDEELVILPEALTAPPPSSAAPPEWPEAPGEGTMVDEELVILPESLTAPPSSAAAPPEAREAPESTESAGEGTMVDEELVILPESLTAPPPSSAAPAPEPPVDQGPVETGSAASPVEEAAPSELAAAAAAAEPAAGFALRVLGFGPPRSYPLHPGENRIGRAADAEVRIASPEVSRLHAVVSLRGGRLYLADAGSRNRTFVDDQPIAGEVEVTPANELRFGSVEAEIVAPGAGEEGSA